MSEKSWKHHRIQEMEEKSGIGNEKEFLSMGPGYSEYECGPDDLASEDWWQSLGNVLKEFVNDDII